MTKLHSAYGYFLDNKSDMRAAHIFAMSAAPGKGAAAVAALGTSTYFRGLPVTLLMAAARSGMLMCSAVTAHISGAQITFLQPKSTCDRCSSPSIKDIMHVQTCSEVAIIQLSKHGVLYRLMSHASARV